MDRIVLMPVGKIYFVEMKKPSGVLSKMQIVQKKRIENLGFKVIVISSKSELEEFIKECLEENQKSIEAWKKEWEEGANYDYKM